jgi:hypothetical protein
MAEWVGDVDICDVAKVVEMIHEILFGEVLRHPPHEYLARRLLVPPAHPLLLLAVRVLKKTKNRFHLIYTLLDQSWIKSQHL